MANKIATYNKEDINTDKAPAEYFKSSVEQDNRNNGKGSQAVYFGSIFQIAILKFNELVGSLTTTAQLSIYVLQPMHP